MLLSSSSRKESLGSTPSGMPASGVFFSPQPHVCISLSTCLWQSIVNVSALSKAGEILLSAGYSPHSLREVQHVERFRSNRDCHPGRSVFSVRVRNLVCKDWQI